MQVTGGGGGGGGWQTVRLPLHQHHKNHVIGSDKLRRRSRHLCTGVQLEHTNTCLMHSLFCNGTGTAQEARRALAAASSTAQPVRRQFRTSHFRQRQEVEVWIAKISTRCQLDSLPELHAGEGHPWLGGDTHSLWPWWQTCHTSVSSHP